MNAFKLILVVVALALGCATSAIAQVAAPTVTLAGGVPSSAQTVSVTLNDSTSGATLYYTTDRTNPSPSSLNAAPGSTVLIPQNTTLNVQAYAGTNAPSVVVTSQLSSGASVASGANHTLFLKSDGSVWASGDNSAGELGNNDSTGTAQSSPVQVMIPVANGTPIALAGVVSISAGKQQSFAVDNAGQVWAWGANSNGELANGTTTNAIYPTQVLDANSNPLLGYVAVSTCNDHTIALKDDGSVWTWGANNDGQIGNGTTSAYVTVPTQVASLCHIVAIAAGDSHCLALDNSDRVWAWGSNSSGQLGNSAATPQPTPALVSGVSSAIGVSAGNCVSYALLANGTALAWGANAHGQLGAGVTVASSNSPVSVYSLTNAAVLGNGFALDANGNLFGWGDNTNGELGVGIAGSYATYPLTINLALAATPTLTLSSAASQSVSDGGFSTALVITATQDGSPVVAGTAIDYIVTQGPGLLAPSPASTVLSPILQIFTNAQGQATGYLQEPSSATGTSTVTGVSGSTQSSGFSIAAIAAVVGTDTPTMPEWMLFILAALLFIFAMRQKSSTTRQGTCE